MNINGIEGMSAQQLADEVARGGRFVIFSYCVSIVVLTFKRPTDVYFIRAGESAFSKSWPWVLLTLLVGWWGFPFGLIYTPWALIETLGGGTDVTAQTVAALGLSAAQMYQPAPPGYGPR